jgi:Dimerisation and cyclophilin-binding domain of Mon2
VVVPAVRISLSKMTFLPGTLPHPHRLRNKNLPKLSLLPSALSNPSSPRAVFLSAIPAIIQTMNDGISQGDDKQLKILHTLLSLITDFSTIHSKLLAKVRAFVLGFFFSSLTDGLALLLRFRLHE